MVRVRKRFNHVYRAISEKIIHRTRMNTKIANYIRNSAHTHTYTRQVYVKQILSRDLLRTLHKLHKCIIMQVE